MTNLKKSNLGSLLLISALTPALAGGDAGGLHCQIGGFDSPENATGLALSGGYLYVTSGAVIRIFDVADPAMPTLIGEYPGLQLAWDIEVVGDFAYVLDYSEGLLTLDVSDPTMPVLVDAYDIVDGAVYDGLATDGATLAIAAGSDGTLFLDLADPAKPVLANQFFRPGAYPISVWMFNGLVFTESWSGGIGIFEASDPYSPQLVLPAYTSLDDIAVVGDTLYGLPSFGYNDRVWISDLTDPTDPVQISMTNSPWGSIVGSQIVVDNNRMYYTVNSGDVVFELDVTDPADPQFVRTFPFDGFVFDMIVDGDYLFIAGDEPDIVVIDLSENCTDCIADLTSDGSADIFDVFAFLDGYLAKDPASDFTRDGYFDINDVFYFLELFNAGCP